MLKEMMWFQNANFSRSYKDDKEALVAFSCD